MRPSPSIQLRLRPAPVSFEDARSLPLVGAQLLQHVAIAVAGAWVRGSSGVAPFRVAPRVRREEVVAGATAWACAREEEAVSVPVRRGRGGTGSRGRSRSRSRSRSGRRLWVVEGAAAVRVPSAASPGPSCRPGPPPRSRPCGAVDSVWFVGRGRRRW